jgi:hypothetical protein
MKKLRFLPIFAIFIIFSQASNAAGGRSAIAYGFAKLGCVAKFAKQKLCGFAPRRFISYNDVKHLDYERNLPPKEQISYLAKQAQKHFNVTTPWQWLSDTKIEWFNGDIPEISSSNAWYHSKENMVILTKMERVSHLLKTFTIFHEYAHASRRNRLNFIFDELNDKRPKPAAHNNTLKLLIKNEETFADREASKSFNCSDCTESLSELISKTLVENNEKPSDLSSQGYLTPLEHLEISKEFKSKNQLCNRCTAARMLFPNQPVATLFSLWPNLKQVHSNQFNHSK